MTLIMGEKAARLCDFQHSPRLDGAVAVAEHREVTRFAIVFLVILVALFAAELTPPVQQYVVIPWTDGLARVSAGLITLFDPNVLAVGKVLQSTRHPFAVSIEAGCNGIEAALILISGILAFPAPWKLRFIGIAAGLVAVQVLNVVRVASLFYLGQWSERAFEWAHLYLWQALIMLDVLVVWLVWTRMARKQIVQHAA